MAVFVEKYTEQQRDAMAYAYDDLKIRPAKRVCAMAKAGALELDGTRLDPFEANEDSVRHYARLRRKRRLGLASSTLTEAPHRDAMESVRRRLLAGIDLLIEDWEKRAKKAPEKADAVRLGQIAKAAADVDRLDPTPETRRPSAGVRDQEGRKGPRTRTALAQQLIREAGARPSENGPQPVHEDGEHAGAAQHAPQQQPSSTEQQEDGGPGALARSLGRPQLAA